MSRVIQSFGELTAEQQARAGGKGGALARLYQSGYPTPDGFVILPTAFADDGLTSEAWNQTQAYLDRLRGGDCAVPFAVRSSAMGEDSAQASFAGEFETVLNVVTDEDVHRAILTVYHSRRNERVQAYSQAQGLDGSREIAVIVQRLVYAERAGVLFTAHPVTGRRDQAMISAAWGLGEAVVGGLVTPDTLVVAKATGRVLSRETADKQVMTVRAGSGTEERPVPEAQRRAPVLSDEQAAELVRWGARIEADYRMPMDIEWAWAEGEFFILQARPITALPLPEPPPPSEWKLPEGAYMAMRNNIVELMADPLAPLFATLGRSAINASMGRLLADFFGDPGMVPDELIIIVNQYAYYNGSWSAWQMLKILLSSVGISKRMFTGAVERWTEQGRPRYIDTVQHWLAQPWQQASTVELLSAARELSEAAIDAYGALVGGVIPAAWISEGLFTLVYNVLVKRRGDPAAPTFLLGFDSLPIQAEKSLYDLAGWARERDELAAYLGRTSAAQLVADLAADQPPAGVDAEEWAAWRDRFQAYLDRYGHAIYNLDFGTPVPADDPLPTLQTLKLFAGGEGANPHERQQAAAARREQATQAALSRLKGLRRKLFRRFLASAQRYAPLREDGLAEVGLSYPLLRQMLREVGRRLVQNKAIAQADDIFWLRQEEVEQAAVRLDAGEGLDDLTGIVPQRKAAWQAARRASPPLALPQIKLFGVDLAELKARKGRGKGNVLKGVATSPGRVTAPARVLAGPEDFARMETGEVLVAALTTPAWTPLFARAAAVVTDVGGPLSHGSIVAREYGIPAVLGTGTATTRIRSGQMVTVDGSRGEVILEE